MKSFTTFAFLSIPLAFAVAAAGCSNSNQTATPSFLLTPLPNVPTSLPVGTSAPATTVPTTAPTASPTSAATASPTSAATASPSSAPTAAATPTASPSSAATTAPSAAIVANPASLDFPNDPSQGTACASYNAAQTFSVTESGYAGTFTATIDKAADASVTAGPATSFTVTPTSSLKTVGEKATVTVTNTLGGTATVAVTFSGNHFCLP